MIEFWALVLVIAAAYTVLSAGTQLQFGFAGLLNFGSAGFALIAAYTMAILVVRYSWNLWGAAAVGVILSGVLGAAVAIPTARLRQVFLGIATVGLSEILRYLALNLGEVTGGPLGTANLLGPSTIANYDQDWLAFQQTVLGWIAPIPGIGTSRDAAVAMIFWVLTAIVITLMTLIVRSPWGRSLRALREDENAAIAMGKNAKLLKVQAFAIGSVCTGIAGIMLAWRLSAVTPVDFDPTITLAGYLIVFISGMGRMAALPVGAVIFGMIWSGTRFFSGWPFDILASYQQAYLRFIMIGVLLIVVVAVRPQGIFGRREELVL